MTSTRIFGEDRRRGETGRTLRTARSGRTAAQDAGNATGGCQRAEMLPERHEHDKVPRAALPEISAYRENYTQFRTEAGYRKKELRAGVISAEEFRVWLDEWRERVI